MLDLEFDFSLLFGDPRLLIDTVPEGYNGNNPFNSEFYFVTLDEDNNIKSDISYLPKGPSAIIPDSVKLLPYEDFMLLDLYRFGEIKHRLGAEPVLP